MWAAPGCVLRDQAAGRAVVPTYDPQTGRLVSLEGDRNGNGTRDTRAFMDGARLQRIEIDRDEDGKPDRWEYYGAVPAGALVVGSIDGRAVIERAEESGAGGRIVRREAYVNGEIARVELDADADGRTDKWEFYQEGELYRMELDMLGKGFADRRLVYGPGGILRGVQVDPDGDGAFDTVSGSASSAPIKGS
jgi:hypothetical protein